ncbi:MAG: PhnD/SsuA/transferrin family substrate-binding protein [Anaerolineae bacterium]
MDSFKLMVCPHDTAQNPEKWYFFTQYLSNVLKIPVYFENFLDFAEFHQHLSEGDIIYANPQDSINLITNMGFAPLARPDNKYDEVVFIAGADIDSPTLRSLAGERVASVTRMLPTKIALYVLNKHAIKPKEILDSNSWLGAVNNVIKGEVNFAFLYKDTYESLSAYSKEMIQAFFISEEKLAFHCLNIGPRLLEKQAELTNGLSAMDVDEAGREVLKKLELERWLTVSRQEIETIKGIIEAY